MRNAGTNKVHVKKEELFSLLRNGGAMTGRQKLSLVAFLSFPAMLAQLSTIIMQYIDAMMVGHLGANATASIGLVSTTTWLFGGLTVAFVSGFSVQVAQHIGAKENERARDILRQGLLVCLAFALLVSAFCVAIHSALPRWLHGAPEIWGDASSYFLVWSLMVPVMQLLHFSNGMLRSSGNMSVPMFLGFLMCVLDVGFNSIFIPRWGVTGAAMATALAGAVCALLSITYLLLRSKELKLVGHPGRIRFEKDILLRSLKIGLPMGVEHVVFCGAQIVSTLIVAPLGTVAIAANAIGITVESLCYMPGYGIGDAATTLVGQSIGAKRFDLVRSFSSLTVTLGVVVMTALGVVMYLFAPDLMQLMSIDPDVQRVGTEALRIESYAEPMYAVSIVAYGVFVGCGDTLVPSIMNLCSIWMVRIPLAWYLSTQYGLSGVWMAMCIELCVRGSIFLLRLKLKDPIHRGPHATEGVNDKP